MLQAFTKLSMLAEQRGEAYANADARVSLEGTILVLARSIFAPFMIPFRDIYPTKYLITLYLSVQRLQLSRATVMFLS